MLKQNRRKRLLRNIALTLIGAAVLFILFFGIFAPPGAFVAFIVEPLEPVCFFGLIPLAVLLLVGGFVYSIFDAITNRKG